MAIAFAFISFFTWGIGVFFEAVVARRLESYSFALWGFVLSAFILTFYTPFALSDLSGVTIELLLFIFIIGIIGLFFGTIVYYEALKLSSRALVGTIATSFPAVTVIISVIFLNERLTGSQLLSIIVIFIGLILASINFKELRNKKTFSDKGVMLAFVPMIAWGTWIALIKIPVQQIGWFWPNYLTFLLFPLLFLFIKVRKIKLELPTVNNAFIPLVISMVMVRAAEFSYNIGISKGLVSVVAPIAGANPILFIILAFIFFKDKITRQQILGIITTLIGIVLLSVLSV
ncbi:MAG: hypothetical protein A2958_01575 [Candidatus Levybacteria bacterium RIFCSPLOWO2_01_FULL_38_13]|nr:MAG: hypothetical protein A2958_01575 [Candidatus Levybacteria bacterium RIFCSPLOWO2_01_FULL_38_13]